MKVATPGQKPEGWKTNYIECYDCIVQQWKTSPIYKMGSLLYIPNYYNCLTLITFNYVTRLKMSCWLNDDTTTYSSSADRTEYVSVGFSFCFKYLNPLSKLNSDIYSVTFHLDTLLGPHSCLPHVIYQTILY